MEDTGRATIQLKKEGVNERDITVTVRVDSSRSTATGAYENKLRAPSLLIMHVVLVFSKLLVWPHRPSRVSALILFQE